jgi:hypothetical protein
VRNQVRLLVRKQLEAKLASDRRTLAECKKLLSEIKRRCPGLLPPEPLPQGQSGARIELTPKDVTGVLRTAMSPAKNKSVLWVDGDNELLVETSKVDVQFNDGLAVVKIPVRCDQAGRVTVLVPFAIGSSKREAGMLAATETQPRGPEEVTSVWGEALTALAWRSLLQVVTALSAESGQDVDGAGLIPIAMSASENGLSVLTMARHSFDRIRPR